MSSETPRRSSRSSPAVLFFRLAFIFRPTTLGRRPTSLPNLPPSPPPAPAAACTFGLAHCFATRFPLRARCRLLKRSDAPNTRPVAALSLLSMLLLLVLLSLFSLLSFPLVASLCRPSCQTPTVHALETETPDASPHGLPVFPLSSRLSWPLSALETGFACVSTSMRPCRPSLQNLLELPTAGDLAAFHRFEPRASRRSRRCKRREETRTHAAAGVEAGQTFVAPRLFALSGWRECAAASELPENPRGGAARSSWRRAVHVCPRPGHPTNDGMAERWVSVDVQQARDKGDDPDVSGGIMLCDVSPGVASVVQGSMPCRSKIRLTDQEPFRQSARRTGDVLESKVEMAAIQWLRRMRRASNPTGAHACPLVGLFFFFLPLSFLLRPPARVRPALPHPRSRAGPRLSLPPPARGLVLCDGRSPRGRVGRFHASCVSVTFSTMGQAQSRKEEAAPVESGVRVRVAAPRWALGERERRQAGAAGIRRPHIDSARRRWR